MPSDSLDALRHTAQGLLDRAHVPFSESPAAAVVLLGDGQWIPGVRVESASFSLTISALLNAYTTAVTHGRAGDVVAAVLSRPMQRGEEAYVADLGGDGLHRLNAVADDAWVASGRNGSLPDPTSPLSHVLDATVETEHGGIDLAREVAENAYVPASDYPVAAVLELDDGRLIPGVNVEHPDWARILCAERNAVGAAYAYGERSARRLFLTCTEDSEGTPCGACRQVLAELTPDAALWMDRHDDAPERACLSDLLPGSFRGRALLS